jgi:hypothetical protein
MELSERHNKFHVDDYGILILVNMKMSYFLENIVDNFIKKNTTLIYIK